MGLIGLRTGLQGQNMRVSMHLRRSMILVLFYRTVYKAVLSAAGCAGRVLSGHGRTRTLDRPTGPINRKVHCSLDCMTARCEFKDYRAVSSATSHLQIRTANVWSSDRDRKPQKLAMTV